METIKYLLVTILKFISFLLLIVVIWWGITFVFPSLRLKNIFSFGDGDWLPAPGSVGTLLGKRVDPTVESNVYKPGPAYNGYANLYTGGNVYNPTNAAQWVNSTNSQSAYTVSNLGTSAATPSYSSLEASNYALRSSYLRNLSIFQGGHIYTGLTFFGEAKNTMFENGKFPIIIVDANNFVAAVAYAEATTQWSAPGWVRFQVKINSVLPNKMACSMVFQQGMPSYRTSATPVHVVIPVLCN
jgi:hypothetical protein